MACACAGLDAGHGGKGGREGGKGGKMMNDTPPQCRYKGPFL